MKQQLCAATALALVLGAGIALAQAPGSGVTTGKSTTATPAGAQTPAAPGLVAEKQEIKTKPKVLFEIPNNQPEQFDLNLTSVPGASSDLTEGVTAKGYARYVDVEGAKIGQVILMGVEKDGKRESLPANAFTSQFELQATQVDPATEIVIEGDSAALVAALQRLAEEPAAEAEVEPEQQAVESEGGQTSGGDRSGNEQASNYETPSAIAPAAEPVETTRLTAEGCPIRIDVEGMNAIQQTRVETATDGAVTSEGSCSDGGTSFPLKRSYTACSDLVDMEARTATAQFSLFYVNEGAGRVEVAECAPDEEQVFQIVEKADGCAIFLDYSNALAVPQAALVYTDTNNVEVQVRGCQASETKPPVAMVQTPNGCSIRHDIAGGVSQRQSVWTYELDGVLYQAGGCRDDGTLYPHAVVSQDAGGQLVCPAVVDDAGGTVTLQSRVQITVDGLTQYITDCKPDGSSTRPIIATTDGCTNLSTWEHDIAAGVSYGQRRFYYDVGSKRTYVTECQRSDVSYPHLVEGTGWQNNDGVRSALRLNTVYINGPTGRYDVAVNTILPGTIAQPYVLRETKTVPTGELEDDGADSCEVFRITAISELYDRPDGTEYARPIGPGEPIGPVDACTSIVQTPVWERYSTSQNTYAVTYYQDNSYWTYPDSGPQWVFNCQYAGQEQSGKTSTSYYRGTRKLQRDDGVIIVQTSVNTYSRSNSVSPASGSCYAGTGSWAWPGYPAYPPEIWTGSEQIAWNQAEGW